MKEIKQKTIEVITDLSNIIYSLENAYMKKGMKAINIHRLKSLDRTLCEICGEIIIEIKKGETK